MSFDTLHLYFGGVSSSAIIVVRWEAWTSNYVERPSGNCQMTRSYWYLCSQHNNCYQLLLTLNNCWKLFTTLNNYQQMLKMIANVNKMLTNVSSLTNVNIYKQILTNAKGRVQKKIKKLWNFPLSVWPPPPLVEKK